MKYQVEPAKKEDVSFILEMIQDLASFENAPDAVRISEQQLLEDGFGHHPLYQCLIIKSEKTKIGFCLYYFRYSTWKGKSLYLEDLYIKPKFRGHGIGKSMMKYLAKIALDEKCGRFEWQVLDWNEPAINLYKSLGAELDGEWINCRLEGSSISRLAKS